MTELVLVNGEEELLMSRAAQDEAGSILGASVSEHFSDDIDSYLDESAILPVFETPRCFIVWDCSSVPPLPVGGGDLLVAVSDRKHTLTDSKARRIHTFPKLKSYDDNNEYVAWALKEGERFNIDLSRVAVGLFVNSRKSLRKLSSEIAKLAIVASGTVTPEEAKSVLCFSAELSPKSVLEAICEGHPVKALTYLDGLQEMADETGWVIAYVQRHVLQQLRLERVKKEGLSGQKAAERLGVHPFYYRKVLEDRIGLWAVPSLLESYERLSVMDLDHKRGRESSRIGLDAEVVRLSEEARDVRNKRRRV